MDHPDQVSSETCIHCGKKFANCKLKNRHIKRIHGIVIENSRRCHVLCPLCKEGNILKTYENLRNHIEEIHKVSIEHVKFEFCSEQQYEDWRNAEKVDTNYAKYRTNSCKSYKTINYECNRSNTKGYGSNYCKRTEKAGGTIKIHGVCPSKLIVKIYNDGKITVDYWKTHVGHQKDELRSKHLSAVEKNMVIEKLKSGVSVDRILEDARKLEMPKLERINLLNRKDVAYLSTKHNIEGRRDKNEMVAAALKVREWNREGKNFAFFFKPEGETHDILKKEDFALAFMNSAMEDKLRNFTTIVCMDGTHGTNKKGLDLTIMLIKDDRNAGFPVAFFLSNRLDQQVQEVFLGALRIKMQQDIKPEYFMSDDDPKYYNAWIKVMTNKPQRLLCSWHIVKNWNIQGKKIHDVTMRKQMKQEMKRILNETNEKKFIELKDAYLNKLQEANELDFANYLLRYYFQDEDRIRMWAHCYRKNAGINTNMAIESLNNLLKTNQLKSRTRVTTEKLLDTIEDLVEIKMWQRIFSIERPNANNYQDRIIIKAHKEAHRIKNKIEVTEKQLGGFQECAKYVSIDISVIAQNT
ncbi:uncharacterized protein LOC135136511 isoform X1 [Zophobas morio]|uniref:uncharacterized protein LOC135136511 isoform X1 n=1 Tax=Zophobas morio TaxID=2755281 RepID=UPI0030828A3F